MPFQVDNRRTCKVTSATYDILPIFTKEPGQVVVWGKCQHAIFFGCPGCGLVLDLHVGKPHEITAGSLDDVSTLSVMPAIRCRNCRWHGHLTQGEFVPSC